MLSGFFFFFFFKFWIFSLVFGWKRWINIIWMRMIEEGMYSIDRWKSGLILQKSKFHSNQNIEWICMQFELNYIQIQLKRFIGCKLMESIEILFLNMVLEKKKLKNQKIEKKTFPCLLTWESRPKGVWFIYFSRPLGWSISRPSIFLRLRGMNKFQMRKRMVEEGMNW